MTAFTRGAVTALILVMAVPLSSAAAVADCSAPRIGWSFGAGKEGEVRTLYWATNDHSELWMRLEPTQPASGKPGIPELLFVFSICYPGKVMPVAQTSAELRVQVSRNFVAALVPDPKLEILVDTERYDLTGPEFKHWTEYAGTCSPGDICPYTAVLVDVPLAVLCRMAGALALTGNLSGVPFELSAEQRRAIDAFVRRISGN